MASQKQTEMSEDTKTIITIGSLLLFYPAGLLLMWFWTKWPVWVKGLLSALLVIVPIMALLLAVTLIAVNPSRQFSQANDTKRMSDVNTIANAISQYQAAYSGLPTGITSTPQYISSTGADICADLVPNYLTALPSDPQATNGGTNIVVDDCSNYDTEYVISVSETGLTISAPNAEITQPLEITRTSSSTR